jgi:hypothetical protein
VLESANVLNQDGLDALVRDLLDPSIGDQRKRDLIGGRDAPLISGMRRRSLSQGVTYFLLWVPGQIVKVGTTVNLENRRKTLEAEIGPLTLLATMLGNQESLYHRLFAALRTHGEWFRYEEPLVGHIAKLAE